MCLTAEEANVHPAYLEVTCGQHVQSSAVFGFLLLYNFTKRFSENIMIEWKKVILFIDS